MTATPVTPTNPFAARNYLFTIVVPDLGAAIAFYRDLIGYLLVSRGVLGSRRSSAPGAGGQGRRFALLRPRENERGERGVIRLLEAPPKAAANRPRPQASLLDPGLAGLESMTGNDQEVFQKLTRAGIKTITPPILYYQIGVQPMAGGKTAWDFQDLEITTFIAFGPGGEHVFISQGKSLAGKPWPAWTEPGPVGPLGGCVLITLDRWPLFNFYNKVFGLIPTKDQYMNQEACNRVLGVPPDSYFRFGSLGDGVGCEWWEYRYGRPPVTPPFPTTLERTGLAMTTVLVDDLDNIRSRVQSAGIGILGEGALPTPEAEDQKGFTIRGAVGELIEIVARPGA